MVIDTTNEIWRTHPFFPGYKVSNLGNIIGRQQTYLSQFQRQQNNYLNVGLIDIEGKSYSMTVHKVMAIFFMDGYFKLVNGIPQFGERGWVIDHINGNKFDNRISNLEYITHGDNIRRGVKHRNNGTGAKTEIRFEWTEMGKRIIHD